MQEIVSTKFPTRISGRYFVERWEPGLAKKVYVQVVIVAMQPKGEDPTMQIRYVLDGVTEQPYQLRNARYVFVRRRAYPETGTWIEFSLDVQEDFQRLWGQVPPDGTGIRIMFEARYDDKPAAGTIAADVYYDDLFVGIPTEADRPLTADEMFEIQYPLYGLVVAHSVVVYQRPDVSSSHLDTLTEGLRVRLGLRTQGGQGCGNGNWHPLPHRGFVCSEGMVVDSSPPPFQPASDAGRAPRDAGRSVAGPTPRPNSRAATTRDTGGSTPPSNPPPPPPPPPPPLPCDEANPDYPYC